MDDGSEYKIAAQWSDDCNGKKDYDGPILSLSTRYWPRGGGFMVFDTANPNLGLRDSADAYDTCPSAASSLLLTIATGDDPEDTTDLFLAREEFEGETYEEVRQKVESWAQTQMDRVIKALVGEFGKPKTWDEITATDGEEKEGEEEVIP